MKHLYLIAFVLIIALTPDANAETALEPFTYSENFETRELGAWAAYPHWEDTSYNEYFRVNTMVPGDGNLSIEQYVTPYTNVDNYAGAQKLLDMYLVPGSTVTLSYYLKSHIPFEFVNVRIAAGDDGTVEYTALNPQTNGWIRLEIGFNDLVQANPRLAGVDRIKVNALAVLAKLPNGDPDMPFYFGLDDVTVKGARSMAFQFAEPPVYKLSEWKQYIPRQCYHRGDNLHLSGRWPLDADHVSLTVSSFTDADNSVYFTGLREKDNIWSAKPVRLDYPEGLYLGKIRAFKADELVAETEFTIHIAPQDMGGVHPRLWFDKDSVGDIKARLNSPKFKQVAESNY